MAATQRVIMKLIGQMSAQLEAISENPASPSLVRLEANRFLHGEICRTAGTDRPSANRAAARHANVTAAALRTPTNRARRACSTNCRRHLGTESRRIEEGQPMPDHVHQEMANKQVDQMQLKLASS
jgi:hypothetical protein